MTTNLLLAELLDTDGNIKLNGTQTIKKRTTTSLSCWQQQDGTGRLHWYWNTEGTVTPIFYRGNEHALDLTMHGDPALPPYLKFRTANGVGKLANDSITWIDTLLVDPVNFVYTFESTNTIPKFIINDTNITYKGYNIIHQGNSNSLPFLPLTGGTLTGQVNVSGPGTNAFITLDIHSGGQNDAAIHLGNNVGYPATPTTYMPHIVFHSSGNGINVIDSGITASGGSATAGQGDMLLQGYILNDGRAPTKPNELISKGWIDNNVINRLNGLDITTTQIQNNIITINQHLTTIDNSITQIQNDIITNKTYVDNLRPNTQQYIWNTVVDLTTSTFTGTTVQINNGGSDITYTGVWADVNVTTVTIPTFNSATRTALIMYSSSVHAYSDGGVYYNGAGTQIDNGYGLSILWQLLWNGVVIATTQTNVTSTDNAVCPIIFNVPITVNSGSTNSLTLQAKSFRRIGFAKTNHGQDPVDGPCGQSEINIMYF